jgi:hypothetical protein
VGVSTLKLIGSLSGKIRWDRTWLPTKTRCSRDCAKRVQKELALEVFRALLAAVFSPYLTPVWLGVIGVVTAFWAFASRLDPLVIWVCVVLSLGGGMWLLNQLRAALHPQSGAATSLQALAVSAPHPLPSPQKIAPDITLGSAVTYIKEQSQWGHTKHDTLIVAALDAACQRGALRSWGRECINWESEESGLYPRADLRLEFDPNEIPIETHHWGYMRLWPGSVTTDNPHPEKPQMTVPRYPHAGETKRFGYIRLNRQQLEQLYPSMFWAFSISPASSARLRTSAATTCDSAMRKETRG